MSEDPVYRPTVPVTHTLPMVICPHCGVSMQANDAGMCSQCLQSRVDITVGIPKAVTIFWCRNCGRYQRPPWIDAPLESQEMMALCLGKIKNLNKLVRLTKADFVYTEPHSRRIKIRLTVQKDVGSTIMEQAFVVEFTVGNQQCPDCQKSFTEHTWTAVVQVRQHRKHKRTMLMLEQLLIKRNACVKVLQIKEVADGLDFYWATKSDSERFIEVLKRLLPTRQDRGDKLISQDDSSNTKKYKFSTLVEIAPAAKDDLVVLSARMTHEAGGRSPLFLCYRVSNTVRLVDPVELKTVHLSAERYFTADRAPRIVLTPDRLTTFIVLDITPHGEHDYSNGGGAAAAGGRGGSGSAGSGGEGGGHTVGHGALTAFNKQDAFNDKIHPARVQVARDSDMAVFDVDTHLGHMLRVGDTVLGYDLTRANLTEDVAQTLQSMGREPPEVVLVRKTYPQRTRRAERRHWRLRQLAKEAPDRALKKSEIAAQEAEEEAFMQEIEEDPELRKEFNLYAKTESERKGGRGAAGAAASAGASAAGADEDSDAEDGFTGVRMDELVHELAQMTMGDADPADADADGDEEGAAAGGQTVRSGRFLRNSGAPAKAGGFEDDDVEALERE